MSKFKQLSESRQFFWYTTYSCGVPCLLTVLIVLLDVIESIPEPLRPGVGTNKCFLHREFLFIQIYYANYSDESLNPN